MVKVAQQQKDLNSTSYVLGRQTRTVVEQIRNKSNRSERQKLSEYIERTTTSNRQLQQRSPATREQEIQRLSYQTYNTDVNMRMDALKGLMMIDKFAKATIDAMEKALDDPDPRIRCQVAQQLFAFPPPLPDGILNKLIARVWDPDISVRKAVAHSLSMHPDPRAIGPLMGLLGTPDDELRHIVHQSLCEICSQLGPPPSRNDGNV